MERKNLPKATFPQGITWVRVWHCCLICDASVIRRNCCLWWPVAEYSSQVNLHWIEAFHASGVAQFISCVERWCTLEYVALHHGRNTVAPPWKTFLEALSQPGITIETSASLNPYNSFCSLFAPLSECSQYNGFFSEEVDSCTCSCTKSPMQSWLPLALLMYSKFVGHIHMELMRVWTMFCVPSLCVTSTRQEPERKRTQITGVEHQASLWCVCCTICICKKEQNISISWYCICVIFTGQEPRIHHKHKINPRSRQWCLTKRAVTSSVCYKTKQGGGWYFISLISLFNQE
jgi:hypothetical protein